MAGEQKGNNPVNILDRVIFVQLHWTMNPTLQSHHNEAGIVTAIGSGANDGNVLVKFDRTDGYGGQWWIKESRLKPKDPDASRGLG